MNRKAELLEERKKQWSSSRAVSEITEQATKEAGMDVLRNTKPASPHKTFNKTALPSSSNNETDVFLHRLTDKLTVHIRDEMKKEMQMNMRNTDVRETVAEKMDSYLEAELSTHTCKICFELMTSPVHTPILLFPCGHTFCQQCMDTHMNGTAAPGKGSAVPVRTGNVNKKTCPYCRVVIESRAVNQSLKDLIDQFSKQKAMVNDHSVQHLDQVFPARGSAQKSSIRPQSASKDSFSHYTAHSMHNPPHNTHNSGSNGVPHLSPSSSANMAATASRYAAQLKSCEMRYVILKNELEESTAEEAVLAKKKHKIKSASEHLLSERAKLDQHILLLQEERDLIDRHLTDQKQKAEEITQSEISLHERSSLVRNTLSNIQAEMEKLKLFVQGSRSDNPY